MLIGLTLGDVTGIGPEVTLKALAQIGASDDARYLILGDAECLARTNQKLRLALPLEPFRNRNEGGKFLVANSFSEKIPAGLPHGDPLSARAAVVWLRDAAERCLRGELDAVVTAPVNKEAIIRAGIPFVGQTELFSEIARTDRTVMMLLGHDDAQRWLRVALVTTHLPLKDVPAQMTPAKIELAIERAAQSCRDLALPRARVAVCGLNPHAGEGGHMGDEEQTTITPTVLACQKRGLDVHGPLSGDTVFHHALRGEFDAVVAMYHDQGLAPLKAVAFDTGINWTLGLPFIRTSPDHGTAYDIAGKGVANPSSMIAAIQLAKQLVRARAAKS